MSGPSHRINRAARLVVIVHKFLLETDNSRDEGADLDIIAWCVVSDGSDGGGVGG